MSSFPLHTRYLMRPIKCLELAGRAEVCVTNTVLKYLQDQHGASCQSEEVCPGVHKIHIMDDTTEDEKLGSAREFVPVKDLDIAFRFIPEILHSTIRKNVYWLAGKWPVILIPNLPAICTTYPLQQ